MVGTGTGLILSWLLAWSLSGGLETWRRAAIGVTAGFGSLATSTLALLSLMVSSRLVSVLIPACLALLLVICYACIRVARRNRQPSRAPDQTR
jgi:CHASE2 domain-containing sensor protein